MHPNPAFRKTPEDANLAFARDRSFGILAVNAAAGPLLSHVPFVMAEDGATVDLHIVRSNPIAPLLTAPQPAVLAVSGPEGYVSPDWYGVEDQVPTWNYVAVHLRGRLERLPDDSLRPHLDALSARFEAELAPKAPWTSGKMTEGVMERMMRMILPVRLLVEDVQGTWKLSQNKPAEVRLSAAEGMEAAGRSPCAAMLAALMRAAAE